MEHKFAYQTSLLIQKNDDGTFLVAIGEKTFEGTHVALNFVINGKYFSGLDDPICFEVYENVMFDCDVNVEPDETISIDFRFSDV